jgi:hypothetical protein
MKEILRSVFFQHNPLSMLVIHQPMESAKGIIVLRRNQVGSLVILQLYVQVIALKNFIINNTAKVFGQEAPL